MSRIYVVRKRDAKNALVRYVRANTLNGAVRAVAEELYSATTATTDEVYQASKEGKFDVLDAVQPEQVEITDKEDQDDPGPVPLRAV